jgi:hypothetical protein
MRHFLFDRSLLLTVMLRAINLDVQFYLLNDEYNNVSILTKFSIGRNRFCYTYIDYYLLSIGQKENLTLLHVMLVVISRKNLNQQQTFHLFAVDKRYLKTC